MVCTVFGLLENFQKFGELCFSFGFSFENCVGVFCSLANLSRLLGNFVKFSSVENKSKI